MDKNLARSKHAASRSGRRRFSQHRRHGSGLAASARPPVRDQTEPELWDEFQDVLPLDDIEETKSRALDYAELLSRDPFYGLSALSDMSSVALARGRDPFDDALQGIYFNNSKSSSSEANMASLLSLDLDKLAESLATMALPERLALEDETLPSELLQWGKNRNETGETGEEHGGAFPDSNLVSEEKGIGNEDRGAGLDAFRDERAEEATGHENQRSHLKAAEDDLDALLGMLGNVRLEDAPAAMASKLAASEKDLDTLLWPTEPEQLEIGTEQDEAAAPSADPQAIKVTDEDFRLPEEVFQEKPEQQQQQQQQTAAVDEDFDAWLDSLVT